MATTPAAYAGRILAAPVDAILHRILAAITAQHPGLATRLAGLPAAAVLIEPADLPVRFLIRLGPGGPAVNVVPPGADPRASTRVRAPIQQLIALAEARIDADTIFFSRALTIDGDIEPVLALRNALEGEAIDIIGAIRSVPVPLAGSAGPFGAMAIAAVRLAGTLAASARAALLAPALDRLDQADRTLQHIAAAIENHGGAARSQRRARRA